MAGLRDTDFIRCHCSTFTYNYAQIPAVTCSVVFTHITCVILKIGLVSQMFCAHLIGWRRAAIKRDNFNDS